MTDLEKLDHAIRYLLLTQESVVAAINKLASAVESQNEMLLRLINAAYDGNGNGRSE